MDGEQKRRKASSKHSLQQQRVTARQITVEFNAGASQNTSQSTTRRNLQGITK